MKDNRHQEYLTELKRHKWTIVDEASNRNCIHPDENSNSTCGQYGKGVVRLIPQGKINYPETYVRDREFWICPQHLSFYQIDKNQKNHE